MDYFNLISYHGRGSFKSSHLESADSPVELLTRGGDRLTVSFVRVPGGAREVVLEGPAAFNFEGSVGAPIEE